MGLLDILNTDDGRFGLGLLAAAAPRTDGAGFGQRLNEAVGSVDQFKRQKLLARLQELQAKEAESAMADKQAQRAQGQTNQAGVMGMVKQGAGFDPRVFMEANPGVDLAGLQQAMQIAKAMTPAQAEFSTTPQYDQEGRAFILGKDGSMKYLDGIKARDKLEEVNLGGKLGFRNPYEAALRAEMPKTQTLESLASNAVTMRGQNMTDARSKEANNIQQQSARTQIMQTPEGLIAIDKGRNQAVPVTMGGSPVRSEDAMKKTANAKTVLSLLDEAEKILPSSTGSAIGAGVDMAAGAAGMSTKGAQSIARLKSIEGQLIASMPRMEGPQSDADRMLYQQAAGDLANSMKPVKTRQAAAETLRKLQQKYVNPGSSDIQSLLDKYK